MDNKEIIADSAVKPFIKWAGGKRSILPDLLSRLPSVYNSYYEPFIGGGALFFAARPATAHLSDINSNLILTFQSIRDNVDAVITELSQHAEHHTKDYYLLARKRLGEETDSIKLAGLFIYLNKTCYNGLYRVNKRGIFNVPIGSYTNPTILDEANLRGASVTLQGMTIEQRSFDQTPIEKGAFYYLDPPYYRTYNSYDRDRFGENEHKDLAVFCQKINDAGAFFMASNSDNDFVRDLYQSFHIEQVRASRFVSCKGSQRGKEVEVIIRNYGH